MTDPFLTRRQSLGVLAGLPALAASLTAKPEQHMFLALNSVLLNGRVKWPEFAELAARTGFPGTDVMLGPAMKAGADATNALLSQLHLRPAVLDLPVEFRKDDATFEDSLAKLDEAARFAAAIHCPRM